MASAGAPSDDVFGADVDTVALGANAFWGCVGQADWLLGFLATAHTEVIGTFGDNGSELTQAWNEQLAAMEMHTEVIEQLQRLFKYQSEQATLLGQVHQDANDGATNAAGGGRH